MNPLNELSQELVWVLWVLVGLNGQINILAEGGKFLLQAFLHLSIMLQVQQQNSYNPITNKVNSSIVLKTWLRYCSGA
jgi:hypothetical protein